jgi:hypothetical protein
LCSLNQPDNHPIIKVNLLYHISDTYIFELGLIKKLSIITLKTETRLDIFELATKLMVMDEETWMRHANPISGWTRILSFPFFILSFWSRKWIGWWCLIPIGIMSLWAFLNPRLFPKPVTTRRWVSRGVLGERAFTQERKKPGNILPHHHVKVANITTLIAGFGSIILIYGLITIQILPTLLGASIAFLGKMWYVDRMVWLFEDIKNMEPFNSWLY